MSTDASASRPSRTPPRWLTPVIAAVVTVGTAVGLFFHATTENGFFDLKVYRSAMLWWVAGNPLYDYSQPDEVQGSLGFTYPPVGAFLLRPLAHLSQNQTITVYIVMAVLCTAASVWWLTRCVARRQGWPRPVLFGIAFIATAGLGAVWIGFDFGQLNPLLWALVIFDLAVLAPRRSRFLGIGVGLATAIKLVPGIFIVYLLLTRRMRATIVASATAVGITLLAHLAAPGDSAHYWTKSLFGADGIGNLWYFTNQSVSGVIARVFEPDPYPRWLWVLICVPIAVYGLWRARRAALAGDELTGMALAGFVGSLISPVTWVHHIFWWVPALLAITDSAFARLKGVSTVRSGLRNPIALASVGVLSYVIVAISAPPNPGTGIVSFLLVNWLVWIMLLLLVTLPIDPERATADHEALLVSYEAREQRRTESQLAKIQQIGQDS